MRVASAKQEDCEVDMGINRCMATREQDPSLDEAYCEEAVVHFVSKRTKTKPRAAIFCLVRGGSEGSVVKMKRRSTSNFLAKVTKHKCKLYVHNWLRERWFASGGNWAEPESK